MTYINFIKDNNESITVSLDNVLNIQRNIDIIYVYYKSNSTNESKVTIEANTDNGLNVYNSLISILLKWTNQLPCTVSNGSDSFVKEIKLISSIK
jgi:hypothetical protein